MREVLSRILEGNYTWEDRALDFSCGKVELSVDAGSFAEGSFFVYAPEGSAESGNPVQGRVTVSDLRMELLTDGRFSGGSAEIPYRFRGDLCEEGDVVKGIFSIVSNFGEYYIPYAVTVERSVPDSVVGEIRNLFHFTNLAKTDWKAAVSLFYAPEFESVIAPADQQTRMLYRALSARSGNERNVEEFLICVGKKQRVTFSAKTPEIVLRIPEAEAQLGTGVREKEIEILRNGWGYTSLEVSCEGDFLFTEETRLTDDHFLGNLCKLSVFLDAGSRRPGRHFGRIVLSDGNGRIEIPVELRILPQVPENRDAEAGRLFAQLLSEYLDYRLGRVHSAQWQRQAQRLTAQMVAMDEGDIFARLFQAQLLITEKRESEAGFVLDRAADEIERRLQDKVRRRTRPDRDLDFAYCYHTYLTTLLEQDGAEIRGAAERVEAVWRRNREDWRIGWLLLYLPGPYQGDPAKCWELLEGYFDAGCRSPLLYMEAVLALNQNPTIARKATGFAASALLYGAKKHALKSAVTEQVTALASKLREFRPLLLRAMELLYEDYGDVRLLQEICSQRIKGSLRDERSREWYRRGVEAQLRLTNLYEYYVASLDLNGNEPVPRIVLMYFAMPSGLGWEHRAYLYRYLIRNKRELAELYRSCYEQIARFAREQILQGNINRSLAVVYYDILTDLVNAQGFDRQLSLALADLLFANAIKTGEKRYERALVYQARCEKPWTYELEGGEGWVSIYGGDYVVALEDADGNRSVKSADFTLEKLMLPGRYLHTVAGFVWDNTRLNLYLCAETHEERPVTAENVLRFAQLAESELLEEDCRTEMALKAMGYYAEAGDRRNLDHELSRIIRTHLSADEKREVLPLLMQDERPQRTLDFLRDNGFYFADVRHLQKLLGRVLPDAGEERDELLAAMAAYVLAKGKPDGQLLAYLARHYEGLCKDLREIWKAAGRFEVDRRELEERLLVQMLYSGAYIGERTEIFADYADHQGDPEVVRAFLAQSAYEYFVCEKLMGEKIFREICFLYGRGEPFGLVEKLACLKYYAENHRALDDPAREMLLRFLEEMMAERIHLGFFEELLEPSAFPEGEQRTRLLGILAEISDKTILDYRARPGALAKLHYLKSDEGDGAQEYRTEVLRDVCGGVCFREFILFYGESIQYYITEEFGGESVLTMSGDLQCAESRAHRARGRFGMLNDMLISEALGDAATLENLREEYARREYLGRELFRTV